MARKPPQTPQATGRDCHAQSSGEQQDPTDKDAGDAVEAEEGTDVDSEAEDE